MRAYYRMHMFHVVVNSMVDGTAWWMARAEGREGCNRLERNKVGCARVLFKNLARAKTLKFLVHTGMSAGLDHILVQCACPPSACCIPSRAVSAGKD